MKTCNILYLAVGAGNVGSSVKKTQSDWAYKFFFIVFESWVNTISALPYSQKSREKCIHDLGVKAVLKTEEKLLYLRSLGFFDMDVLERYNNVWAKVTDISIDEAKKIANIPIQVAKDRFDVNTGLLELDKFLKNGDDIYIYGNGIVGKKYYKYLLSTGKKISGFCVSEIEACDSDNVYDLNTLLTTERDAKYIIALNERNAKEVISKLAELSIDKSRFFYHPGVRNYINVSYSSIDLE